MKVAVIGAGLMGGGIAQACAQGGFEVVNIDTLPSAIFIEAVPEKIEIKKDTFKKVDETADSGALQPQMGPMKR